MFFQFHGDKVHRLLLRKMRCIYHGNMGTAFFTESIIEVGGGGERSNQRTNGPVNAHLRTATYAKKTFEYYGI